MKKIITLLLFVSMITTILVGCGNKAGTPEGENPVTSEPTADTSETTSDEQITLAVTWENLTEDALAAWQKCIIEPFEAEHPDIKIDFQPTPDWQTVIQAQLMSGAGPDIFMLEPFDVMTFSQSDLLLKLDKYSEKYGWSDKIFDWALQSCTIDGSLMAVPHAYETCMFWYNQELLDKYGWKVPETREEFVEVCEEAQKAGIVPIAYGIMGGESNNMWVISDYMSSYCGTDTLNKLYAGELKFTDPEIRKAFELYYEDYQKGWYSDKKTASIDYDAMCQLWQSQKALFIPQGSWYARSILTGDITFDFGVTEFPSMCDGVSKSQPVGIGATFAVNANTENADAAAEFIDFVYDEQRVATAVSAGLQTLPMNIDTDLYPDGMNEDYIAVQSLMGSVEAEGTVGYTVWTFCPGNTTICLWENIDKLLMNEITMDEYLEGAQTQFETDLADGWTSLND